MTTPVNHSLDYIITLIIPIYNVEEYIGECLRSVLRCLPADCDVICVNDATPDCSMQRLCAVLAEFPNESRQVSVLEHATNRGLSAARNTAIAQARGRFIALLDSDDCLLPEFFTELKRQIKQYPGADIVSFNATKLEESRPGQWIDRGLLTINRHARIISLNERSGQKKLLQSMGSVLWCPPLRIYSRRLLLNYGFPEDVFYEDVALIPELYVASKQIVEITQRLMAIRGNPTGIQTNPTQKHLADVLYTAEMYAQRVADAHTEIEQQAFFLALCSALYCAQALETRISTARASAGTVIAFQENYGRAVFAAQLSEIARFLPAEKMLMMRWPRCIPLIWFSVKSSASLKRRIRQRKLF